MISQYVGSNFSTGLIGMSPTQYAQIKNKQNQYHVLGLVSGIPNLYGGFRSPFSSDFLNQVYDAKALTPRIINNYLKKVDEVIGVTSESGSPSLTTNYQSFVDKMLIEKNPDSEEVASDTSNTETGIEESESESPSSDFNFYGIVGEIFDKYS